MPSFKAPASLMIPEGLTDGQAFDAVGTFIIGKYGKLTLCKIDGEVVPGYEDKADKLDRGESAEDEEEKSKPMNEQLQTAFRERRGY